MIIKFPKKLEPFRHHYTYKAAHGGRGSAKSRTISGSLVLKASQENRFILCAREIQKSIKESSKKIIEDQIKRFGLESLYKTTEYDIKNIHNGSRFIFMGLSRNLDDVRSIEGLTDVWIEEAQNTTMNSIETVDNTIRADDGELWFSWNPKYANAAVDQFFRGENGPPPNSCVVEMNWRDNRWFPERLEIKRQWDKLNNPRYLNIWEGKYLTEGEAFQVLPYDKLLKCVDAHIKLGIDVNGIRHAGLDIADEGNDTNAWACRKGPLLEMVDEWNVKFLHMTAAKADFRNKQHGALRMYYDASGMGAGIKSDLSRIPRNPEDGTGPEAKKFIPFHFGGRVQGGDRPYIKAGKVKILNKDFFYRVNAQAWWNLRLRLEQTMLALDGQK